MSAFVEQAVHYIRELPLFLKAIALTFCVAIEYVFPIFPGDTILLFAGFLSAKAVVAIELIFFATLFGTLMGTAVAYGIGTLCDRYKSRWAYLQKVSESRSFKSFEHWYQKWGAYFLLFNRFFPGIRAFFFFAAGAMHISLFKVLLMGCLSALIFNAVIVLIGYWLGFNVDLLVDYFYHYNAVAALLIITVVAVACFYWFKKARR